MFITPPVLSVVSQPFKRSQLGLFQGKTKQYGNNVPFSKHKTRRTWLPNVQRKRLHSETLGEYVQVKLTTRALRTIKKHGGLDKYVEKTSYKTLGWEGMRLRLKIREMVQSLAASENVSAVKPSEENEKASGAVASSVDPDTSVHQELTRSARPSIFTKLNARMAREQAMTALGLNSPPNARSTIAYLKQLRKLPKATTATSSTSTTIH